MPTQENFISCKHFDQLSTRELYSILQLRIEVFCVEQECPYLDTDGKDLECWHLLIQNSEKKLIAYSRLIPKGISYPEYVSIGRVVCAEGSRKKGLGKLLMEKSMENVKILFGDTPIKIGAQAYLIRFYESLGFISTGENYLEDGIPHVKMIRN